MPRPEVRISETAFRLDPVEYLGLVETINRTTLAEHRRILGDLTLGPDQAIVLVGSDGKFERHTQSKTELTLLQASPDIWQTARHITQRLALYPFHYEFGPGGTIEVQNITHTTPLSWAYTDRGLVYPDRLLNSLLVVGNPQIAAGARVKVLYEISLDPQYSRSIRRHMSNQLREYKLAMSTGIYRGRAAFSSNQAIQYYKEGYEMTFGFKSSHLRTVQRWLDDPSPVY